MKVWYGVPTSSLVGTTPTKIPSISFQKDFCCPLVTIFKLYFLAFSSFLWTYFFKKQSLIFSVILCLGFHLPHKQNLLCFLLAL